MGEVRELRTSRGDGADGAPRYVRVTNGNHNGYIEFQFSIGDPGLFLEMMLPPAAFAEFCERHGAVHLTEAQARAVDADERKWRYGNDDEE